jgi:hypothetical protein
MLHIISSYWALAQKINTNTRVYITAVQEPVFWAGVSDQWLSTTLDQNPALLIGSWQNHEGCEQAAFYVYNTSVIPTLFFIQFWLFRHIKIYHGSQNQMFSKTYTS